MKKLLRFALWAGVGLGVVVAALLIYARIRVDQPVRAPLPPIAANRSPEARARGETIFRATCVACHVPPGGSRASGGAMAEVPRWLGVFNAPNLTSDPNAGIGAASDAELARAIRYGVSRRERAAVMPPYSMSDDDIAAVLGFLRSDSPLFAPDPSVHPPPQITFLGALVVVLTGATNVPDVPPQGIQSPPKAPTPEYGRYLAFSVYACADCHTAGFDPKKLEGPEKLAGGQSFRDPIGGGEILSANLTFDETGLAGWRQEDLGSALRAGERRDHTKLRPPMPLFAGMEDVEVGALFSYLESLPHVRKDVRSGR